MKTGILRLLKHTVALIAGSAFLGALLLTLVYCMPVDTIKRHVASSCDSILLQEKDMAGQDFIHYIGRNRESFTDSIMVQYAFEKIPGKSAFEHAMWAYHSDLSDDVVWDAEASLRALLEGGDASQMHLREYSRYWHGYLVYLKPLLSVFTWGQLMWLGVVLQVGLMAAVCAVSVRKKCPRVAAAVLTGSLFMKLPLMLASLAMSVCWLITLTALLVILLGHNRLEEKKLYPEFFLCIGILVAYFDFLTYPTVTLGFPLCTFFLLKKPERAAAGLKKLVGYSFMWGVGYGGMWACKWVIADLTLRSGTIKNALWTVLGITTAIGGRGIAERVYGGARAIRLNLQEYDSVFYPVLGVLLGAVVLTALVRAVYRRTPFSRLTGAAVPYLAIGAVPFVWIVAAQYHSAVHARFTFRIIGVAVMAACGLAISLWRAAREPAEQDKPGNA